MKRIFFALALTVPAFADVISYTQNTVLTPTSGFALSESGSLEMPRFDPSLGVLNSISMIFGMSPSSGVLLDALYRPARSSTGFTETSDTVNYSLLGMTANFSESTAGEGYHGDPYLDSNIPCGTNEVLVTPFGNFPNPCPDTFIPITRGNVTTWVNVTEGAASASSSRFGSRVTGEPSSSLAFYTGVDPLEIPFSVAIQMVTPTDGGMVIGGATVSATLYTSFSYNYTPASVDAPVDIAATPEPRFAGLLLFVLVGGFAIRRRVKAAGRSYSSL